MQEGTNKAMADVLYLICTLAFFAMAAAFTRGCARL
jgi:hypothetical protein